jgi:hypothetical protein
VPGSANVVEGGFRENVIPSADVKRGHRYPVKVIFDAPGAPIVVVVWMRHPVAQEEHALVALLVPFVQRQIVECLLQFGRIALKPAYARAPAERQGKLKRAPRISDLAINIAERNDWRHAG